jgi:hypothetical protein
MWSVTVGLVASSLFLVVQHQWGDEVQTHWSVEASGRMIATIGKMAVVMQSSMFIDETAIRVGCGRGREH